MSVSRDRFFEMLWSDYVSITPQAERVFRMFVDSGETFENDHVAFRTFDRSPLSLASLIQPFLDWGFRETGRYRFEEKRLNALSLSHPEAGVPRVFLSELDTEAFSPELQSHVRALLREIDPNLSPLDRLLGRGGWPIPDWSVYQALASESEYAAWVAAFGLRANHFTVSINSLQSFSDVNALNDFLEANGFVLNSAGGKVKGSPEVYLEQSSTMADRVERVFREGDSHEVPSCYVEFARRFPTKDGSLFEGFVAQSADRIFESTQDLLKPL